MSLASNIGQILRTHEAYTECTFSFAGGTYQCSASTDARFERIERGDRFYDVTLNLFVRVNALPPVVSASLSSITADSDVLTGDSDTAPPKSGRWLVFNNHKYRILNVTSDPLRNGFYRLELGDFESGR